MASEYHLNNYLENFRNFLQHEKYNKSFPYKCLLEDNILVEHSENHSADKFSSKKASLEV